MAASVMPGRSPPALRNIPDRFSRVCPMIEISATAQAYLRDLLAKQDHKDVGIRVFVTQPGTPQAETCIAYCRPGEEQADDIPVAIRRFHRVDREAQRAVPRRRVSSTSRTTGWAVN